MGVVEGTKAAMAQIDQVVSDPVTFAPEGHSNGP